MDIGNIYKKAWKLTKNNKPLWIFGVLLAVVSGSAGSMFNSFGNSKSSSSTPSAESTLSKESTGDFIDVILNILVAVPVHAWVVLMISILVSIIVYVAFGIILKGYAVSSSVGGVFLAQTEKNPSIRDISKAGLSRTKDVVILNLIVVGLSLALVLAITIISIPVFFISTALGTGVWVLLFLPVVFLVVVFNIVMIWAVRLLVKFGVPPVDAFKLGFKFLVKYLKETVLIGVVNCFASILFALVSCVGVVVIGGLLIGLATLGFAISEYSLVIFLPLTVLAIPALIFISGLLGGIFLIFKVSTWNLLFEDLIKDDQNLNPVIPNEYLSSPQLEGDSNG